ncbi:MAG TPA: HAD family hydrolase [Anaerolineales bacterium]|nr:HAD family hydrolase [Anaerolineales bacterium]
MPIDLSRIRAICFDLDGTLSDTDDQFVLRLVKILTPLRFGTLGCDIHRLARKIVMTTEGPGNWVYSFADRLGLDGMVVTVGDWLYEIGIGKSPSPFQLVGGSKELLEKLKGRYPLSLISARGEKSTFRFLRQFELFPYFQAIATGQTCIHTKPYADPIIWAAQKMEVPVGSCLMVGDTVVDIQCGKNAGAQTIGVLCGFGERKELERAGADHILENTLELIDLLVLH